jgi:transketolase
MDREIIANIKTLGIDMIKEAGSGHPGIVLGAAPIIYTLYAKHININVNDEKWLNRDRFVMSAGHGSALLYATLFMAGFSLTLDDLKNFRKIGSKTPGHPELGVTPGVDMSTGPLGQGIATAVGMAIAEKKLENETKLKSGKSLINHKIYVLCGDGDLMEGVSYEATSLAGSLNLNNLIVLYDSNNVCLDGNTNKTFNDNVCERFKAMGWNTIYVKNGNDVNDIDKAINSAKKSSKPTLIQIKTVIGNGSLLAGTNAVHGKGLTDDDIKQLKFNLQVPQPPFYVNEQAREELKRQIYNRSNKKYDEWATNYRQFELEYSDNNHKLILKDNVEYNLLEHDFYLDSNMKEAMRVTNKTIMNEIAKFVPNFIGGSADLASATNTYLENLGDFSKEDINGKNIWFGVREHAMGSILNGISLYNYRVFGSTFFSFSDYMKPAMRMAAIMKRPINYIFTHDSISVGQDGPTHQPVEQLAMLRAIPNFNVFRPCDAKEIIGCWNIMINSKTTPSALIISRNEVPLLETSDPKKVMNGAYIVEMERGPLDGIIIATGTEVHNAIHIARDLYNEEKINIRVVSMPSRELFLKTSPEYQEQILPKGYKKFVIEAASSLGWERFVYSDKYLFTVNMFGASGTKDDVYKYCHFDYQTIKKGILDLIR